MAFPRSSRLLGGGGSHTIYIGCDFLMIVVNFFAGAGAGKSTISAEVFSKLKKLGYKTELVGEYAKECILQQNFEMLKDQLYLFATQVHRLRGLEKSGVDIAVSDSPLPLNLIYGNEGKIFEELVWHEFNKYDNMNYLLDRIDGFWQTDGRVGDEKIARKVDKDLIKLLKNINYISLSPFNGDFVIRDITERKKKISECI